MYLYVSRSMHTHTTMSLVYHASWMFVTPDGRSAMCWLLVVGDASAESDFKDV